MKNLKKIIRSPLVPEMVKPLLQRLIDAADAAGANATRVEVDLSKKHNVDWRLRPYVKDLLVRDGWKLSFRYPSFGCSFMHSPCNTKGAFTGAILIRI